jgi:hypothetical protein
MHSALTGVQVLVTRTTEHATKREATEISYSDARSLGFNIVTTGFVILCLTMIQKRKPPRTKIASCFNALSITYQTDPGKYM